METYGQARCTKIRLRWGENPVPEKEFTHGHDIHMASRGVRGSFGTGIDACPIAYRRHNSKR